MRTLTKAHLIATLGALLLTGCAQIELVGFQAEQALTLSKQTTLDAAGSGQAGYYCRRVICAGDDSENQAVRGLLEFDLSALPKNISSDQIASATLRIYQSESGPTYARLQSLLLEHIQVPDLRDFTAFDTPALETARNEAAAEGYLEFDVTEALRRDLALGRASAQFRLRFSQPTNHDHQSNLALFSTADDYAPQLLLRLKQP
ncbi:MAG: hypothetical protein NZN28_11090 [Meiothermus sp.]|uniref:hypothetical protein n=1 Tax=Meiothermus sp. TaxID=1955249 RepID=UPI0025E068AC|nr:hypothetical protein [Meiothermus sp.]MCS7069158.1 hypothetical protein [Meiothermus sp.]